MEHALPPEFQAAADIIAKSQNPMDDVQKLQFYALYKQATTGACNVSRPGFFDFVGKAKWDAWNELGTLSRGDAASRYVALARQLAAEDETGMEGKLGSMLVTKPKPSKGMGTVFSRPEQEAEEECPHDICYWAQAGNLAEVNKLLGQGVKIDAVDEDQRTALMWACDRGHLEVAQHLVKSGANVNAKDMEGQTPLHYAVLTGEAKLVSLLLQQSGIDVAATDNEGLRPTDLAESAEIKSLLPK